MPNGRRPPQIPSGVDALDHSKHMSGRRRPAISRGCQVPQVTEGHPSMGPSGNNSQRDSAATSSFLSEKRRWHYRRRWTALLRADAVRVPLRRY